MFENSVGEKLFYSQMPDSTSSSNLDPTAFLPDELLLTILSHLDFLSVCSLAKPVSRRWRRLSSDALLLREIFFKTLKDTARVYSECCLEDLRKTKRARIDESSFFLKNLISDLRMGSEKCLPSGKVFPFPAKMNAMNIKDQKIYFASSDKAIYICDNQLKVLSHHLFEKVPIEGLCIQTLDQTVFCGSLSGNIHVLNEASGEEIMRLEGHRYQVSALEIVGDRIYSASWDQTIRIWDRATGMELKRINQHTIISCLKVYENNIYSGSMDDTLRVWDAETGLLIKELKGHTSMITCLQVERDAIYSGSRDQTIRIWDRESGSPLHKLVGHKRSISSLAVFNDKIISGSLDNNIKIWGKASGLMINELMGHTSQIIYLKAENGTIISGSLDQTLRVWDFNWQEPIP